jgi:hypothetical protein
LNDCLGGNPPTLSAFGRAWLMGKKKSYESRTTGPPEFGSGRRALGLQIERPVGERRPRICCKHKLRGREGDPTGSQNPAAVKSLLDFQQARKGFYHSWTPKRTTVQRLSHKRCGKGGLDLYTCAATRIVYALGRWVGLPMSDQQLKSFLRRVLKGFTARNYRITPRLWQPDFSRDHSGLALDFSMALTT